MTTLKKSLSALRHKQFQLYLGIRFLLSFAGQWQTTVLGFYVYQLTHSKMAIAFVGLSEVIPAIGIALYGGYITDKGNKRTLLLLSNLGLVIVSLAMLPATWHHPGPAQSLHRLIGLLYVLLFISGFVRAFYEPALFAIYSRSVPRDEYANAASWNNLSWQLASVTGPLVAGFGYAFAGRLYPGTEWYPAPVVYGCQLLAAVIAAAGDAARGCAGHDWATGQTP